MHLFRAHGADHPTRRWRKWAVALAAAVTALTVASVPAQAAHGVRSTPPPHNRSGLPWDSGVFVDSWSQPDVTAFGTWRGAPLDVAVTWPARATWDQFTLTNPNYQAFAHSKYTMVFGVPPIPEDGSATMAGCAAGDYTSHWVDFAQTMRSLGLGSSVIRLGWEFNGNWYVWGGGDPATFAQCWRQIVSTVRAITPRMRFDWNVNRGSSAGMPDDAVLQAYPGDAYVDYVGIDNYDQWGDWNTQLNGGYGLNYWLDFAVAHGKRLSVPEWGLYPGSPAGYGDDPAYMQHMHDFFAANAAHIAYEAYLNEPADYIADSIYNPVQNPLSSAVYLQQW